MAAVRRYWYVLAVLVGLTLASRRCGGTRDTSVHRLALSQTWDPNTPGFLHVVSWRRGDTIYVQTEGREPIAVYRDANLVGEPEIEGESAGMYAITSRARGSWTDEVLIRLKKDGSPTGSVSLPACMPPVVSGLAGLSCAGVLVLPGCCGGPVKGVTTSGSRSSEPQEMAADAARKPRSKQVWDLRTV
jgi:hypothetical protein